MTSHITTVRALEVVLSRLKFCDETARDLRYHLAIQRSLPEGMQSDRLAFDPPPRPQEPHTAPSPLGTDNARPDGEDRSTGSGEAL